ncbi:MAG TPA: hypothetical protein VFH73_08970 [Polyangia bacterium]|nr:hypothetical protein [Polyangia bacterium]
MIRAVTAAILMVAGSARLGHTSPVRMDVTLSVDPCVDVDGAEVQRLTELQLFGPFAAGTPSATAVKVTITCAGGDVTMSAWDPTSDQRAQRTVPLGDTARVTRPRLLAVSAVELAATVLAEANARAALAPPRASAVVEAGKTGAEARQNPSSWRLLGFGGVERFPKLGDLTGGGIRFGWDGRTIGSFSLDAQAGFVRVARPLGNTAITSVSLAPLAGIHRTFGHYTLRAETGPRLAVGHMVGEVPVGSIVDPTTTTLPWIGWQLQLGTSAVLARHLVMELTAVGGYVIAPLGGKILAQRQVAIEGAWLGAFLSFGGRADLGN